MTFEPLPASCFEPSARIVAPRLLGHWLLRRTPGGRAGGLIVEVEAYLAGDPACHACRGRTPRNQAMFGPPGRAYVYFIYGNHWCFNAVCRPAGVGEAVLVRAIEPVHEVEWMRGRRPVKRLRDLTNGPGKLCAALDLDGRLDGLDLGDARSPVFLARNPERVAFVEQSGGIAVSPRIGLTKAADWPLRFYLERNEFVSRPPGRNRPAPASEPGEDSPKADVALGTPPSKRASSRDS